MCVYLYVHVSACTKDQMTIQIIIQTSIRFTIIQIQKQTINYSFAVFIFIEQI